MCYVIPLFLSKEKILSQTTKQKEKKNVTRIFKKQWYQSVQDPLNRDRGEVTTSAEIGVIRNT